MANDISEPALAGALLAIGAGITKVAEMLYNKITNRDKSGEEPVTLTQTQARQLEEIHAAVNRLDTHMRDAPNHLFRTSVTLEMMRDTLTKQVEILSAMQFAIQMSAETLKSVMAETHEIKEKVNNYGR